MIRRPPRSTPLYSSAASDVYKRQVFPSFTSVRCAGAVSSSSGALTGGWRSSEERGRPDSSMGSERATSSGNPAKTSFFFVLPLGLADFFATRGIKFSLADRRPGGMLGRNGRHSLLVNQKEKTVQSGAAQHGPTKVVLLKINTARKILRLTRAHVGAPSALRQHF